MFGSEDVVDVAGSVTFLRGVGINSPFVVDNELSRAGQLVNDSKSRGWVDGMVQLVNTVEMNPGSR